MAATEVTAHSLRNAGMASTLRTRSEVGALSCVAIARHLPSGRGPALVGQGIRRHPPHPWRPRWAAPRCGPRYQGFSRIAETIWIRITAKTSTKNALNSRDPHRPRARRESPRIPGSSTTRGRGGGSSHSGAGLRSSGVPSTGASRADDGSSEQAPTWADGRRGRRPDRGTRGAAARRITGAGEPGPHAWLVPVVVIVVIVVIVVAGRVRRRGRLAAGDAELDRLPGQRRPARALADDRAPVGRVVHLAHRHAPAGVLQLLAGLVLGLADDVGDARLLPAFQEPLLHSGQRQRRQRVEQRLHRAEPRLGRRLAAEDVAAAAGERRSGAVAERARRAGVVERD